MPIFPCPACGKTVRAPDETAGKRARCPRCKAIIEVPSAVYEAEVVAEPESEAIVVVASNDAEEDEGRRPCPMCGELIMADALKCRYCGEIFDKTLKKKAKKKRGDAEEMTTGDYVCAVICPGIGCIAGIIWCLQGKSKGPKMLGLSVLFSVFWSLIRVIVESSLK